MGLIPSLVQVRNKARVGGWCFLRFVSHSRDAGALGAVKQDLARAVKRWHLRVSAEDADGVLGLQWQKGVGAGRDKGMLPEMQVPTLLVRIQACMCVHVHKRTHLCIYMYFYFYSYIQSGEKKILLLIIYSLFSTLGLFPWDLGGPWVCAELGPRAVPALARCRSAGRGAPGLRGRPLAHAVGTLVPIL